MLFIKLTTRVIFMRVCIESVRSLGGTQCPHLRSVEPGHQPRALTPEEVHRLLAACQSTHWHPIFHTLIWTGLRRSELLGLRWKDIDLDLATLRVVQVLHQLNGGAFIFQEPKISKGRRVVSLSPATCILLRAHRERQEADGVILEAPVTGEALVFGHPDSTPRAPATLTHAFTKLVRRIGLDGVRLHDLRHTHASLLLLQGANPKVVSERLGHSSIQITLDYLSSLLYTVCAQEDCGALPSSSRTPRSLGPTVPTPTLVPSAGEGGGSGWCRRSRPSAHLERPRGRGARR